MTNHEFPIPVVVDEMQADAGSNEGFAFDDSWGIDTVRLSFPIDASQCDFHAPLWAGQRGYMPSGGPSPLPSFKTQTTIGGHSVRVELYTSRGFCHIEFNAANFTRIHPYDLAPAEAVATVAQRIIESVSTAAWPTFLWVDEVTGEVRWDRNWQSRVHVKRLDVSRNLQCEQTERIKRVLAARAHRASSTHHVYRNPGGGWGLVHSTRQAGQDKIYDKSIQMPLGGSEARLLGGKSVLRFEAELKKDRLESAGMKTLDCLNSDRVIVAIEMRWETTGWGSPIPAEGSIVAATSGMSYDARARVIGHVVLSEAGVTDGLNAKSQRRWDAKTKAAGLVAGMPVVALGEPDCYLDIRRGRLVDLVGFSEQRPGRCA